MKPIVVSDAELAFPANVEHLVPPYEEIPEIYKKNNPWDKVFSEFFYNQNKNNVGLFPKEGIDPKLAWRHISCVMGTYSIKHEHKIAGCCYLFDKFFREAILHFTYAPGEFKSLLTGYTIELKE